MSEKVGVFNRLAFVKATGTAAALEFEFLEGSTLGLNEQFIDANTLRGSRFHAGERTRKGPRRSDGTLLFAPTPLELDTLLVQALGTTKSSNAIALAETLPTGDWFAVRDGTIWHYPLCVVETLTLTCTAGGPFQAAMTVVGTDEIQEGTVGTSLDVTTQPYVWGDLVVTVAATPYLVSAIEISIQNVLEVKYRSGTLVPASIKATDSIITCSLGFSQGDAAALYGSAVGGVAVVATFTNGAVSLGMTMASVQTPREPLPFGQRGVLDLPWRGVARKSGSTLPLVIANDSTP